MSGFEKVVAVLVFTDDLAFLFAYDIGVIAQASFLFADGLCHSASIKSHANKLFRGFTGKSLAVQSVYGQRTQADPGSRGSNGRHICLQQE